jgi:CDP-paratose 2-epimerase
MLEAIKVCEAIAEKTLDWSYVETNRIGDHIWWISDVSKFKSHYPDWNWKYNINDILTQIYENTIKRQE